MDATSGVVAAQDAKSTQHREIEERNRIAQYVTLQSREIEALKMELIMLKRKEAPQMMPYAGNTGGGGGGGNMNNSSILPPINPK